MFNSDFSTRVILLERDEKRVKHYNEHIIKKIPSVKIFKAVDSKTEKIEYLLNKFEIKLSNKYINKATRGQLGCTLSNISLWKEMVEKNIKNLLIIEDDVFIPDDFDNKMNELLKELPSDYDFLYLFVHPHNYIYIDENNNSEYYIKGKNNIVKAYKTYGTVGYLISLNGAKKLLENFNILETTIDDQIKSLIHTLNSFTVKYEFLSTIGQIKKESDNNIKSNVWNTEKFQTKIKNFQILGERCSGTNYLEKLMLKNFKIESTNKYGHKHFFGISDYKNSDETLFIGIIRNPHTWANSLYKNPWHISSNLNEIEPFLNNEFVSLNEKGEIIDKNIYTGEIYKNIFESRHIKLKFLIEDMKLKVKNYILIKYEDLRDNFENTMSKIKNFNIDIKKGIKFPLNIETYKGWNGGNKFEISYDYKINEKQIYDNKNFIPKYEKMLNYMPHVLQNFNVLVINMDIKKERLENIFNMLSKYNITFERIPGFVPSEKDIKNSKLINVDKLYQKWLNNGIYLKGVLGCKTSHINAIKRAKELDGPTLILEDDVFFEEDILEIFDKSWDQLKNFDWDIFYLGANLRNKSKLVSKNVLKTSNAVSFCSYIINKKSSSKIIKILEDSDIEVDSALANASLKNKINQYTIWPMVTYVDDDISSNTGQHTFINWRNRYKKLIIEDFLSLNTVKLRLKNNIKEQLMKNITIIIKTFIRPDCCICLVESIIKKYPKISIIVADDGDESPDLSSYSNVKYMKMPFDSGVSAGRNLLMDNVKTKYYLSVDDDMVFTESTNLEIPYKILEENCEIDMVGGNVNNIIYHGLLEKVDDVMNFYKKKVKKYINNYPIYDIILQFYLVRTDKIVKIKYDPELKIVDHMEFFWRAKNSLNITYIGDKYDFKIINKSDNKYKRYKGFRGREIFLKLAQEKMGIKSVCYL